MNASDRDEVVAIVKDRLPPILINRQELAEDIVDGLQEASWLP